MLWNFNASVLWNFYFDLTGGVKIPKLAVNVYFGNNGVMDILLKTSIEYPSLIVCHTIKAKSSNNSKTSLCRKYVFINELQV